MITVKHCHGLFAVWSAEDAIRLRTDHHILGNLVGALPAHPRQHSEAGLPLMLMPEEVRLLVAHRLATIVDQKSKDEDIETLFTSDHFQAFHRQLQAAEYQEMNTAVKAARRVEIDARFEAIAAGKARKLGALMDSEDSRAEFEAKLRAELYASIVGLPANQPLQLPSRFHLASPYQPEDNFTSPPPTFQLPPLAPRSLAALKFAVFEHFWRRGYYLSDGLKFGAHFLAYDHSPVAFHAKFIVVCLPEEPAGASVAHFEATLLQAYGRLGKNVRKNVVIAHWKEEEEDKEDVAFKHVQWNALAGFS